MIRGFKKKDTSDNFTIPENKRNSIMDRERYIIVTHFKRSYYIRKHVAFECYDMN